MRKNKKVFYRFTLSVLSGLLIIFIALYTNPETVNMITSWQHNPLNNVNKYLLTGITGQFTVDVIKDFGAKGDGITDDTNAIQLAVDTVFQQGGGTIIFPAGTYIVTSINIRENITYEGYGAIIKRPDNQGKWTRTFTTEKTLYSGEQDSQPLIIRGFIFEGNSQHQGNYQNYELEQAHFIFLMGNPEFPGRLKAIIEDCRFQNGVADGISIYTNVDVKVYRCEAINVFRGGFVLTGGYSNVEVYNLITRGEIDNTGIDIEVDGRGYGNSFTVNVKLENINLINGDFDVAVEENSNVIGKQIFSDAPFLIFSRDSTMIFSNSKFKIGAADEVMNRILFPYNVTFDNCEFYATRKETGRNYVFFSIADIWWQHPSYATAYNQSLVYKNCSFKVDSNIKQQDKVYAFYLREDLPLYQNKLEINQGVFDPEFDAAIISENKEILIQKIVDNLNIIITANTVKFQKTDNSNHK